jgi:aspartate/methionine/tyrosine aminotransferase
MPSLIRVVGKLPLPTETKLSWQRALLDRSYAKDIAEARKVKDKDKVASLEGSHRFEIEMHEEDEDAYITKKLLQNHYTGRMYLTTKGIAALREEIRRELKARHEARSQWVVWLSALTGVIGAITGLVALLTHKS